MERRIRIRTAGLFVKDEKILLVKHSRFGRQYYLLPGGGQEPGESAECALAREWKEELNVEIVIDGFLFLGESLPQPELKKSQLIQLVFRVKEIKGEIKVKPDGTLVDYEWAPLQNLHSYQIFPPCQEQILAVVQGKNPALYQRYVWIK